MSKNINPTFEDLKEIDTITNHLDRLKSKSSVTKFPIHVFPNVIQDIVQDTHTCLNFPIDYIGTSILFTSSVAIGNSHHIEVKKGYTQTAVLYVAIVGRAGINKSHVLSFFLKPIHNHDNQSFKKYEEEFKLFKELKNTPKKERIEMGYPEEPEKPIWYKHLISDFTPEALAEVHKHNKRGISVYVDELATWFQNFNRYNQGSEETFWLSCWSGKPINIDRKTSEPTHIPKPFVSVGGTIQNAILKDLATNNRSNNGFLDRILFAVPQNLKKPYLNTTQIDENTISNWNTIIDNILNCEIRYDSVDNPDPQILKLSNEAFECYNKWHKEITDFCNNCEDDKIVSVYSKLEMYVLRLALILELLHFACDDSSKQQISVRSVKGAIELIEFFKCSALRVQEILNNPLTKLSKDKLSFYHALPESFSTSEAAEIGNSHDIKGSTLKRFLKDQQLFEKVKRGIYEKLC